MRTILHLDMDAFFAAIEQRDHPEWRGKPVVVGAPPDRRGVVSTASYEARAFGIHSAMPSRTAGRLCPHAIFARPRMAAYQAASDQLMAILRDFTPDVEPVSVDEAFLDAGSVLHFWPSAEALARAIQQRIRTDLRLTASIGVAPNKFLAKIGSDLHKPDGLTLVPREPDAIRAFLAPLPVTRLFGVGKVTGAALEARGIRTIGDLQAQPEKTVAGWLGPALASHIHGLAFGRDDRPLTLEWEEKSLSRETTFDTDCADPAVQRQTLVELAESVGRRLRALGKLARTVQIKVRFPDFRTITRQAPLPDPADADRLLIRAAQALYGKAGVRGAVRLIGFGVMNLVEPADAAPRQRTLFEEPPAPASRKDARLDRAVDALRARFGRDILTRGRRTAGPAAGEEEPDNPAHTEKP